MKKTQPHTPSTVAVIGGGIAGLATAALLANDGHSVTLLERRSELGGRAGSWEAEGFRFDTGPSWYLMPEVFEHFFRLMGTTAERELDLVKLDPGYQVLFEGEDAPVTIAASAAANRETFERLEPGAGRQFDRYVASAKETYTVATESFLYTNFEGLSAFTSPKVLRRAGKLVRLLLQPLHSFASGYFRDSRLRRILGYPAVFLGSSPFVAPAMYHLMSHLDLTDGVYYPNGGFTTLIAACERVAREAGVTVITEAEVERIEVGDDARVTGVRYRAADGSVETISADAVVSGADLHHTETSLLEPRFQSRPEQKWDKAVPGPGTVLVFLGVEGELPLEHHTLLFTEAWKDNFERIYHPANPVGAVSSQTSLYVCHPSRTDPSVAPEGTSNLFVLVPVPSDPALGGEGDAEIRRIADNAIAQIAAWANIPDLEERILVRREIGPADFERDYNSWKGTSLGLAHTTGQSAFFRGSNASEKVAGLYYAGATTVPGIGLPMCLISAELVLKRMRGDRSNGPLPEPALSTNPLAQSSDRTTTT
ncbi:phytoene desaturase family protein [Lysinibacter cavernae]|uniref:Phytoene desaturase n=1 Tax=Lysinibacter cavernae TaxID=1640652 RepID=A0A7X5R437_9MICO|nr:phytoene desaturase [Lysinibacter cavernae]